MRARPVSLRRRLVIGMLGLVTVALAAFALAGYLVPQTVLALRLTSDLTATARGAAATVTVIADASPPSVRDRRITAALTPLLRPNESIVLGPTLVLSSNLSPQISRAVAGQALADRGGSVFTVGGTDYETAIASTSDGPLVVLTQQDYGRGNLYGLLVYQAATGGVLLVVLAALGVFVVRRGLRPLDTIVDTASAITRGERDKRIPLPAGDTEVGRVSAALNQMLDETQASEARLRQFIADASHELRTPLASVRSYAELLRTGAAAGPEQRDLAISRIESQATRMGTLVDDLLLLARLDMGRPLHRHDVDLATLAREVVDDENTLDPDRTRTLTITGTPVVRGDTARLRQVLTNLLANARTHTPPHTRIVVHIGHTSVTRIVVTDTGPGLGDDPNRVFERFYRADTARTNPGSGLGLAIADAIVKAHHGTIHAENIHPHGARFTVEIPEPTCQREHQWE